MKTCEYCGNEYQNHIENCTSCGANLKTSQSLKEGSSSDFGTYKVQYKNLLIERYVKRPEISLNVGIIRE